jgi:hypothetical protein
MRNQKLQTRARARRVVVLVMLLALGAFLELHTGSAPAEVRVAAPAFRMIARERPLLDPAMREHVKREKERERTAQFVTTLAKRAEYERLVAKSQREKTWDALARCESAGNWNVVDRYGGGLGIYIGTWRGFGGGEFASNPGYATKEQQIIVAERVYARYGFDGWGCAHNMGWVN